MSAGRAERSDLVQGQKLFHTYCAPCHQDNGAGNPVNNCPTLVGSEWVTTKDLGRIVRIISKGLSGPIQVKGNISNGIMPAIGDQFLPGTETEKSEQIAAIISYVRKSFAGNDDPVPSAQVQAVRGTIKGHAQPFTLEELLQVRPAE
jgi:mono/diheme cytochrome c family protein